VPAAADGATVDNAVRVEDKTVAVPELRFHRGVRTLVYGEAPPQGNAVRLRWEPVPGAAGYGVGVSCVPWMAVGFRSRMAGSQNANQNGNPQFGAVRLWRNARVTDTFADCPLLELAPDQPAAANQMQYQYRITALDASGQMMTRSAYPLSQFHLSSAAVAALLKEKPPRRFVPGEGRGRGPFAGLRRRRLGGGGGGNR
jgi:hypothetical protein